jgi:vancomycin permeability regulator SanA
MFPLSIREEAMNSLLVGDKCTVWRAKKAVLRMIAAGLCCVVLLAGSVCAAYVFAVSGYIKRSASEYILTPEQASQYEADCILVLGAGINERCEPRLLLRDRLNMGVELYYLGVSDRLLMSGDHGRKDYDEVNAMRAYAMELQVELEDIFMDHAGFSTYESMYRARDVFGVDSVIIVTQRYHLYRAVYIARSLGLEAYGVACDPGEYHGQIWLDAREVLARNKDLFYCLFQPEPTYLGDMIPISGSGIATAG